jgi:hypothetical protein
VLAARIAQGSPLAVKFSSIQQPDPRLPSHPVTWLLWRYEGTDALPNLPPPSPRRSLRSRARLESLRRDLEAG